MGNDRVEKIKICFMGKEIEPGEADLGSPIEMESTYDDQSAIHIPPEGFEIPFAASFSLVDTILEIGNNWRKLHGIPMRRKGLRR